MNRAPTPCIEQDCYEYAVNKGRCQKHYKPWVGSTRKQRLPRDWETRRQIVFRRDNWTCHICGSNNPPADTIDHVIQGDDHSLENLKPVHDNQPPHCHRKKSAKEGNRARIGNQIKKNRN